MKVVCINNEKLIGSGTITLTVGKTYEVVLDHFGNGYTYYEIQDDLGNLRYYETVRFLTPERWREVRLKDIGL
jgi:hypothetical protein